MGNYAFGGLGTQPGHRGVRASHLAAVGAVYVVLLAASHLVLNARAREREQATEAARAASPAWRWDEHVPDENGSEIASSAESAQRARGAAGAVIGLDDPDGALGAGQDGPVVGFTMLPQFDDAGAIVGSGCRVSWARWEPPARRAENGEREAGPRGALSPANERDEPTGASADARGTDAGTNAPRRVPVILLHGSPGSWRDFALLAPKLARAGYVVIAPDMPGFGGSSADPPSYSTLAHARSVLALMEELGIARAHVLGFSMGGGVALHLAALTAGEAAAEEREGRDGATIASVTLLSSVSTQETEGSGSHAFEHFKYGLGRIGLVWLARAVPHFGLLGPERFRESVVRNFSDTDQRLLTPIMQSVRVPTLILHGRHDFLVPDFGAERAHELIGPSRLVMLDASHFIPFLQADEAATHLLAMLARHDDPAAGALRFTADLAPVRPPLLGDAGEALTPLWRVVPWWAKLVLLGLCARVRPRWTFAAASLLVAGVELDPVLAGTGVYLGRGAALIGAAVGGTRTSGADARALGRARDWAARIERRSLAGTAAHAMLTPGRAREAVTSGFLPSAVLADARSRVDMIALRRLGVVILAAWVLLVPALWAGFFMLVTTLIAGPVLACAAWTGNGLAAALGALAAAALGTHVVRGSITRTGRRLLAAECARARHHEFWNAVLFYVPVGAYLPLLALRYRATLGFSCCNPGISAGGGTIGENKSEIYARFVGNSAGAVGARGSGSDAPGGAGRVGEWSGRGADGFVVERMLPLVKVAALARDVDADVRTALGISDTRENARLTPRQRAQACAYLMARDGRLRLPVILKPDSAQRGFALRLARTQEDAEEFFRSFTRDAVAQAYHPGPVEIGVLWVRHPEPLAAGELRTTHGPAGFVFAVTEKVFPRLKPDGKRTLEELLLTHPRFRMQSGVFFERFAGRLQEIPAENEGGAEGVRLGLAGNHCQGTLFRDGAHLLTPQLEAAVDRVARSMTRTDGGPGGLDFGRFDLRARSIDELRHGDFAVVELNGAASEATNIYDPDRSPLWAYSVLFRQWKLLYQLGSIRRAQGAKPLGNLELIVRLRRYYRGRPGSEISD